MIEARDFVEAARGRGFGLYAGVPCSFLKPFINNVIDDPALQYVSAANEGDAVAIASGAALAGQRAVAMMQNSGLGNAVSPLSSLNWVFRLPVLLIITWRGMPGTTDEPQHELMGQITRETLDTLDIPWAEFPEDANSIDAALDDACAHMDKTGRAYALIMKKDTIAAHALQGEAASAGGNNRLLHAVTPGGKMASRREALAEIQKHTADESAIVFASTGFTGRELFALDDRPNQLYMVGSMGCVSSFGLGYSICRPEQKTVVIDGDGAALMRMGNFSTVGAYGGENYVHVLLDNEVHDSTGGQATVSGGVQFAAIAAACGYASCSSGDSLALVNEVINQQQRPAFLHLKISAGAAADLPRPAMSPAAVKSRLMEYAGISAPWRNC
jgi:phosphonopyruvate decarboxylase